MVNGLKTVSVDDNRSRMENKRIYGNQMYLKHNWGLYAEERRKPTWNYNVCQLMREHIQEVGKDPERLSTDFIMNTVFSLKKD